jgi:hypothetical protein
MRLREIALAAPMLLASAAFTASYAQSSPVSEKTFDWIFFAIIGLPFLIGLVALVRPNWLDNFVREWPWESRLASLDGRNTSERSDPT